eukprot:scaffold1661_cov251-Pinguiococcus_pyrenoidosus.AAC.41
MHRHKILILHVILTALGHVSAEAFRSLLEGLSRPDEDDMARLIPLLDGLIGEQQESSQKYRSALDQKIRELANELRACLRVALEGFREESQAEIVGLAKMVDRLTEENEGCGFDPGRRKKPKKN